MELSNEIRGEPPRRPSRASASECWVYTREGGLREVTLASPRTTLSLDGQLLRPWCLLDRTMLDCALAILYSADVPSRELRDLVTQLARARFENRPWFPSVTHDA